MTSTLRRALTVAAAAAAAAAALAIPATPAFAIDEVPCGRSDFASVKYHETPGQSHEVCFANSGEANLDNWAASEWLHEIWTGNNRVQWYGDGRWQPEGGINKWTRFTFPNNPGGVSFTKIRIL
ncbi:hypothetical protein [Streptosporangium carneum]|uniref:Streptomyces killer toxin-like beta/gamma crystallin domain-containing protein n=1 Tax=Streptosporangium carneum TaxID=47481 RepID=A0A9W6I3S8_9ACTN|nr:hypothetical protein [Streptosporangium carneum]GLK10445.1 hypothetical protein GCM10017600_38510 [Streptosporangium carneum]